MKMRPRLSALYLSLASASLILMSPVVMAAHGNFKGEGDYKGEYKGAPPCLVKALHDGFYVGIAGGYDSYRVRRNTNFTGLGVGPITDNPPIASTGFVGGLLAGYGQYFENLYYLGAEIFGNVSGASANAKTTGVAIMRSQNLSTNGSYGIGILPGLKMNDSSLFYIRLGYNWANLKSSENFSSLTSSAAVSGSTSKTEGGFNYGLGIESAVYENLSLRGEFSHTNYNSYSNNTTGTKYTPSDNQFMLGLLYHFA